jgi:superoxide reductase
MTEQRFYICRHCGNIIAFVQNSGVPVICCGEEMQEIIPGTVDASVEKHLPVIAVDGNIVTVTVGSVLHPMVDEHYIQWISLQTKQGNQRKELAPGEAPVAKFALVEGDEVVAAYEYCNLHGLWKTEAK